MLMTDDVCFRAEPLPTDEALFGTVTCAATCPKYVGAHHLSSQRRGGTQRRSRCPLDKSRQSQALKLKG